MFIRVNFIFIPQPIQGIGAGIAVEFARAGADVAFSYFGDIKDANEIVHAIEKQGRRALAVASDAGSRAASEALVSRVEHTLGPVSILVTNAITSVRQSLLETKETDFRRTLDVGLHGVFDCMQLVARRMVALKIQGSIIHITSPHAPGPFKNALDYNVAKAAAHHLALSAANELAWHKIRVNLIQPGWTVTPGERRFYTQAQLDEHGSTMALGRMQYPVDLGRVAVFLAGPDASYVAGAVIRADGAQFIEGGCSWVKAHDGDKVVGDTQVVAKL